MIVTEEEAKSKRCQESFGDTVVSPMGYSTVGLSPFQHSVSYSGGAAGSVVQSSPSMCIGSACMAWRWADSAIGITGYCGKAGKP
jgi:hypothetical protein